MTAAGSGQPFLETAQRSAKNWLRPGLDHS